MKYTKRGNIYVVRLEKGENIIESLREFAKINNIKAAMVNGIGAVTDAKIGIFDIETKKYNETIFKDNYEITSLIGNITTKNDEPYMHLHINFSGQDCICYGGHFIEGKITITAEIIVTEIEGSLNRYLDEVGINLIEV
ncbi:MAG: DNA-binding protein [Clostridium perfringens]|nr:DNA-binding protein [Clostridium perfringens]